MRYLADEAERVGRGVPRVLLDAVGATLRHGMTIKEFAMYGLVDKSSAERADYLGGRQYQRYFGTMNCPVASRALSDKIEFHRTFGDLTGRAWIHRDDLGTGSEAEQEIFAGSLAVAKDRFGRGGESVGVIPLDGQSPGSVRAQMDAAGYDLLESHLAQHHRMAELSDSAVNTVRVMTHLEGDDVTILGVCLRISNGGHVDNASQGGLVARVDRDTGTIVGGARALAPGSEVHATHPRSGTALDGRAIPLWGQVLELAATGARRVPAVRSIGWDVAICEDGPVLIEGNHRWMRELWQVAEGRGTRADVLAAGA